MTEAISEHREPSREARRERRRYRRANPLPRPQNHRARLRMTYFGIAAVWGFLIGSAGVLGALSFMNLPFEPDGTTVGILVVSAVMAVAGGFVVGRAYRDAAARRGR